MAARLIGIFPNPTKRGGLPGERSAYHHCVATPGEPKERYHAASPLLGCGVWTAFCAGSRRRSLPESLRSGGGGEGQRRIRGLRSTSAFGCRSVKGGCDVVRRPDRSEDASFHRAGARRRRARRARIVRRLGG